MNEIAASDPGQYFVFDIEGHAVLASVDTTDSNSESATTGAA